MDSLVQWFTVTLGPYVSKEALIFIISMLPILELRGGLLAASLLKIQYLTALPLCVLGNVIPIPFILLFLRRIFALLKKTKLLRPLVEKMEGRAIGKSDRIQEYEFFGLLLFVGIPLPGTGAWTGAMIASLLQLDIKKSSIAILLGVGLAAIIMSFVSYGVLANLLG